MATFTFTPDYNATASVEPRVRKTQFMDGGYEHRIRFGLNTRPRSYEFTFGNRTDTEADQIEAFFTELGGAEAFDWNSSLEERRNLLTYTEDMTRSAWVRSQLASVGSGNIGFAGGSNAFGLIANNVNTFHSIAQTITVAAAPTANSLYVKQGAGRDVQLRINGSDGNTDNMGITLNMAAGFTSTFRNGSAVIADSGAVRVGNDGWWRLWINGKPDNNTTRTMIIIPTNASGAGSFAGDNSTAQLLVMGAQMEYGDLTGYQPITTTSATKKWVCERWQRRYLNCNNNTITATFRQVYES